MRPFGACVELGLSSAVGTYIGIVVLGIAIDESIEEECVERKPPVARGRMELVVLPFTPVLQRRICGLVLVEVVLRVLLKVPQAESNSAQAKQGVEEGRHAPRANEGRHRVRVVPSTLSTPDRTSTGHEPAETNAQRGPQRMHTSTITSVENESKERKIRVETEQR